MARIEAARAIHVEMTARPVERFLEAGLIAWLEQEVEGVDLEGAQRVGVVRALRFMIDTDSLNGPVNVVAPNAVTNAEFTETLGRVLGRPTFTTVPAFALKFALGQMAEDTALASQRIVPRRLTDAGFGYELPTLEMALRRELSR